MLVANVCTTCAFKCFQVGRVAPRTLTPSLEFTTETLRSRAPQFVNHATYQPEPLHTPCMCVCILVLVPPRGSDPSMISRAQIVTRNSYNWAGRKSCLSTTRARACQMMMATAAVTCVHRIMQGSSCLLRRLQKGRWKASSSLCSSSGMLVNRCVVCCHNLQSCSSTCPNQTALFGISTNVACLASPGIAMTAAPLSNLRSQRFPMRLTDYASAASFRHLKF